MQKFPALEQVTLTLTYFQTNTETTTQTEQVITKEAAKTFFDEVIAEFVTWLKFRADLQERRDPTIRQLTFPFDHYRPGQRELAVAVYKTIVTSKRLFAEAPTGTGKPSPRFSPPLKQSAKAWSNGFLFNCQTKYAAGGRRSYYTYGFSGSQTKKYYAHRQG